MEVEVYVAEELIQSIRRELIAVVLAVQVFLEGGG